MTILRSAMRIDGGRTGRSKPVRPPAARLLLAVFLAAVLVGCARLSPPPRPHVKEREATDPYAEVLQEALVRQHFSRMENGGGYTIGPNDVIEIHVFGYDKMNMTTRVGGDGNINFPPLGQIRAAGFSERQLETVLQDRLRGSYLKEPHVTVLVKEPYASEVAIVGEVVKPGRYPLLGEKRLIDLLTEAGGMTERSGDLAYIIRFQDAYEKNRTNPEDDVRTSPSALPSRTEATLAGTNQTERIQIDLDRLLLRGEEHLNIALMPGDLVNVPAAGSVHLTGTGVKKPGTYRLTRSSKTLLQVVDEAEGLKFEASNTIVLVRRTEGGTKRLKLNYRKLALDTRNDIVLRAGDTLVTTRTPLKTSLAAIGRALGSLVRFGVYGSYSVPIGG